MNRSHITNYGAFPIQLPDIIQQQKLQNIDKNNRFRTKTDIRIPISFNQTVVGFKSIVKGITNQASSSTLEKNFKSPPRK